MIFPPPVGDGRYNYLMQFVDGNRIDLSFFHIHKVDELTKDSLTKVLLDKDAFIPKLPTPDESSYAIQEPTEQLYNDCCNEFIFGLGSNIPKTIWRKELPLLKVYIDLVLRRPLMKMFEWDVGMKTGFTQSIGKGGKYLQKYLEPEMWKEFEHTYTDANYEHIWNSLFVLYKLFKQTAESVGREYGFQFPEEASVKALNFLQHVKQLPEDANTIY
jgi:aminoglycoside 6-adenylyltransferase